MHALMLLGLLASPALTAPGPRATKAVERADFIWGITTARLRPYVLSAIALADPEKARALIPTLAPEHRRHITPDTRRAMKTGDPWAVQYRFFGWSAHARSLLRAHPERRRFIDHLTLARAAYATGRIWPARQALREAAAVLKTHDALYRLAVAELAAVSFAHFDVLWCNKLGRRAPKAAALNPMLPPHTNWQGPDINVGRLRTRLRQLHVANETAAQREERWAQETALVTPYVLQLIAQRKRAAAVRWGRYVRGYPERHIIFRALARESFRKGRIRQGIRFAEFIGPLPDDPGSACCRDDWTTAWVLSEAAHHADLAGETALTAQLRAHLPPADLQMYKEMIERSR